MQRNFTITAVLAGLLGSAITYHVASQPSAPQGVYAQTQAVGPTFSPVVKRVLPAVVSVVSEVKATPTQSRGGQRRRAPQGIPPGLEEFFGGFGGGPQEPRRGGGEGSGVIVTRDGYVLTNNHVVEGATDVTVNLSDRREFKAKVVGTDPRTDIAVLKIQGTNLPTLPFASSARVEVGDVVLAVGNPFGIGQTVTMGIVSATGRTGLNIENYEDFIQTDAAINPGNSGGALVSATGQLIGINTAIISRTGGNQGIGFAIPIDMARDVMDQLIKTGKVVRGYMGVNIQDISPELARAFKLPNVAGAAVTNVEPGGPAERAGLKIGDVVTAVNGEAVADSSALRVRIARTAPGNTVRLTVHRAEGQREIPVTLERLREQGGEAGGSEDAGPQFGRGAASPLQGVDVTDLTADIAGELQLPRGARGVVVTRVDPGSAAAEAGLRRGDVIQQVNRRPVTSVSEFETAVRRGESALLLVNRGGATRFVVIEARPNR